MMGDMAKVRFLITESNLVGYRAYDYAVGSQNPTTGGDNNMDTPVLVYKIVSHFDTKREYNPGTGEETNVSSENEKDRPWSDRQYMRVDWSQNLADPETAMDASQQLGPTSALSTGIAVTEADDPLTNPDRPIMRRDYVEWTHKQDRMPDYQACYTLFGADDDVGPLGCGNALITYRNSLLPVPDSEYEPLSYPDRQVITNTDGTPLRMAFGAEDIIPCNAASLKAEGLSGDDCTEAALDQFTKFRFFRTVLPKYDRQVGSTHEARQYYANRWNIWQETIKKDADGAPLVGKDGTPVR